MPTRDTAVPVFFSFLNHAVECVRQATLHFAGIMTFMGVIIISDPIEVGSTSNFCHYAARRELISTDRWGRSKRAELRRDEQEVASGGKRRLYESPLSYIYV